MPPVEPTVDEKEKPKKTSSKGKRTKGKGADIDVKTILPHRLQLQPIEEDPSLSVPKLSHNLDRVLFNPGVYHIQDPRSRVFNFDPYLTSIMPVDEFDFDALKEYITSSKDVKLRQLSAAHGMKYCGSTSSMTSILSHFHFLLSAWRLPNLKTLSRSITPESFNFTALSRGPAAAYARLKDGVYAIDADKEYDTENVLSMLGKSMEKLLTLPKEEFEKYRRTRSHQLSEEEKNAEEAYHYTTMGDFMLRSQLDAHDPRLPGTGMFDLKTRAVVSIRMDVRGYEQGVGYEIRERYGQWESFEREFYDMVRAAFLKYSLQVRMGRMDGIFVAFHNTRRIFGFQYISLSEMDNAIHGTADTRLGDQEFKASLALLNELLNRATQRFPDRSLRLHVETRPTKVPLTYFFVEPVTDEDMESAEETSQSSVEQLERNILAMSDEGIAASEQVDEPVEAEQQQQQLEESDILVDDMVNQDLQNDAAWQSMMAKVEETVENESLGIGSVREAIQDALEHSGLLADKTELETEQCLDAMVSSLTAHSSKIRNLRDKSSDEDETLELTRENEDENSLSEEIREEDQSETSESVSSTQDSSIQSTSLKDLILKATEGIDKTQNLTTFQRMFTDLATKSRQSDIDSGARASDVTSDEDKSSELDEDEIEEAEGESGGTSEEEPELLGMYVTIRNKVNGEFVERPNGDEKILDWSIQYAVTELPNERAQTIYTKIKKRRRTALSQDHKSADWHKMFKGHLPIITKKGAQFREERTQQEANSPLFLPVVIAIFMVAWALLFQVRFQDTHEFKFYRQMGKALLCCLIPSGLVLLTHICLLYSGAITTVGIIALEILFLYFAVGIMLNAAGYHIAEGHRLEEEKMLRTRSAGDRGPLLGSGSGSASAGGARDGAGDGVGDDVGDDAGDDAGDDIGDDIALGSAAQAAASYSDVELSPREIEVLERTLHTRGLADDIWNSIKNGATCTACEGILTLLKGLAAFGDSAVVNVVTGLCKLAKVEDADVCEGSIKLEAPIIASAIRKMSINSDLSKLFCSTFLGLCPAPTIPQWNVPFPAPKPAGGRPAPSGKKPLKVVQFSDIHVDPLYVAGSSTQCTKPICCRPYTKNDQPGLSKTPAGPNGDHKCDTPVSLEMSMYQAIKEIVPDAAFTLFTGDIVDHAVWNTSMQYNSKSISDAYSYMSMYLNYVYGTAGNHEANPTNAFQPMAVGNSTEWLYDALQAQWGRWVEPQEFAEIHATGAYSSKYPGGNLRIISLNTNLYYRMNFWMYQPKVDKDPNGQIQWLVKELDAAEKSGERVYIIGHTPLGEKDAFIAAANYFDQVVNRYSSTIAGMFFGHTHADHFEVSYSNYSSNYTLRNVKDASMVSYICPSLTPMSGMPAFRVYDVDPVTFAVLDSTTYIADMNNTAFQTTGPVWTKYYSAKEAYGTKLNPPYTDPKAELTPAFWHNVTSLFQSNSGVFNDYLARKSRGWKNATCTGDCLAAEICQLRAARSQDNCVKVTPGIHFTKRSVDADEHPNPHFHSHDHECGMSAGTKTLSSLVVEKDILDELESKYLELGGKED
ncbi:mRNA degradation protein [Cladobotryum mycophilum]|uniref:mRNA degradation protein n=1 Tax=Cladobotryum mycophilum TaxID=491253 RepID=A0ABR0SNW5_9HYPO